MKKLFLVTILTLGTIPATAMDTPTRESSPPNAQQTDPDDGQKRKRANDDLINACDVEDAQKALERGAEANYARWDGIRPLHMAAYSGRRDVVQLLLANDASPNVVSPGYSETPLHMAVREDHDDIVQLLIAHGANVNLTGPDNRTALHTAASYERIEIAQLLIKNGANLDQKDAQGKTPSMLAQEWREFSAISIFFREAEQKEDERKKKQSLVKGIPL